MSSLATLPGDGLALYAIARAHHAGDPHWFFGYAPGLGPGQLYGHRVHGPYVPQQGLRFNPAKFVIDPNARALAGELEWRDEVFAYHVGDSSGPLAR